MAHRLLVVGAVVMALLGAIVLGQAKPSVQGVWRVVEVSGGAAGGNKTPQPGLVFFTARQCGDHQARARRIGDPSVEPFVDLGSGCRLPSSRLDGNVGGNPDLGSPLRTTVE